MNLNQAYDTLLVPYGAPLQDVRTAFHAEAQLVHPDRLAGSSRAVQQHAEERFKRINEAYQVIQEYWKHHTIAPAGAHLAPETREVQAEIALGRFQAAASQEIHTSFYFGIKWVVYGVFFACFLMLTWGNYTNPNFYISLILFVVIFLFAWIAWDRYVAKRFGDKPPTFGE